MAVESADDRAVFVDVDDFGSAATYTPSGGSAKHGQRHFRQRLHRSRCRRRKGVALQQPRFHCRTADVSSAAGGDALVVGGVNYTIRIVQDDGTGMTMLVLEKD